jgi:hypothetical protein
MWIEPGVSAVLADPLPRPLSGNCQISSLSLREKKDACLECLGILVCAVLLRFYLLNA